MYIVSVLVEHPVHSLDTTFDYLSKQAIRKGVRVQITFNHRRIIGYVDSVRQSEDSKATLEAKHGFTYRYIDAVIDEMPLLNTELQELALAMSKLTLAPRIACMQAMLPTQLKPSTSHSVGIKYKTIVKVVSKTSLAQTKKQQEALDYLQTHQDLRVSEIPYSKALLDNLVKQGCIVYKQVEDLRNPYQQQISQNKSVVLTDDQQHVLQGILAKANTYHTALIHGVTGSGKTEIYVQLASSIIASGKTVIMLVPEISLTPMMVKAFKNRFGSLVAILHSKLSNGERYDEYRRILQQEVKIVVGARSAVFAPLENLGLLILDEEHDSSYKQESTPRYHTQQIARMRAKNHQCPLVLGSATPSLESYSRAKKGIYDLYQLPNRINQFPLPKVELVNMEQEIRQHNYSLFSKALKQKIQQCLEANEQMILLLNKRGYSSYIRCLDCGEVIKCPHCDVTLTYHKQEGKLKCHYCEYQTDLMYHCPNCQGTHLKPVGSGTQKVEEQLEAMFDKAKVIRYDIDTTRNKNGHLQLLDKFEKQEANILLGTQMIAKGLDFENVTFVGVLNADISLHIPDFRANERTFQLLMQVAGRSGRGKKEGTVMIQTFNPDHFVLQCVKNHEYLRFYQEEMKYRKLAMYPPYTHMLSILIEGKEERLVEECSQQIKTYLQKQLPKISILGPANSLLYMLKDQYRKRILLKFNDSKEIYPVLERMSDFHNKQNRKVHVVCDFNPYSQM